MPFFALDDDLNFSAIGKLWVFLAVSVVLTGLTFAVSFLWDYVSTSRQASMLSAENTTEGLVADPDREVMEPNDVTDAAILAFALARLRAARPQDVSESTTEAALGEMDGTEERQNVAS